jgi:hypothetical protein
MAEVTGMRNNALPYPVYGAPWAVTFPILDADGDPVTGATTPDAEVSKNGDTFADCTNESTEIATSSGVYYLLLTAAEMTADIVTVIAKCATAGAKTTVLTFYPRKLVSLRAATAAGGAAGSITLDASASAVDDFYNGCLVVGVLDSTTEARIITDYTGSSKVAAVTPNWNTTPDSDDTFTIYLPEGRQINQANVTHITETAQTARDIGASVLLSNGTGTGQVKIASGYLAMTWADIAAPTTTVNLSGTTIKTATDVETDTAVIGAAGAGLSAIPWNASWDAEVQSECTDALNAYDPPTNTEMEARTIAAANYATASALDAVDNFIDTEIGVIISTLGSPAGASLAADIAAIEAQTDDIGTAGAGLTAVPWNAAWDAEVQSEAADALNAYDPPTNTEMEARTLAAASYATASALDTVDNFLDTEVAAILAAVDTEIATIKAKTDLIPGTIDGKTFSELVTLFAAVLLGKASGLETTTAVYRAVDDSKDRVTATVTIDGNRSAITLDAA